MSRGVHGTVGRAVILVRSLNRERSIDKTDPFDRTIDKIPDL